MDPSSEVLFWVKMAVELLAVRLNWVFLVRCRPRDMVVDVEKTRNLFAQFHQEAVSLSIEAGYITSENVMQILSKAAQSARSVSIESGFMTDETKEQILQKADAQAKGLASQAKDYTPA